MLLSPNAFLRNADYVEEEWTSMNELFPDLFRELSGLLNSYGLIVLIPLLGVIIWVAFPRGFMRTAAVVAVALTTVFFLFGDHPAISPITSAMGAAFYHFRSMLR